MLAGRLFLSDRYGYRFYVALKRSKQHHNQFYHTSHLLSDGVLTAACPWYYTCRYYNAYVYFCLYIEKSPRSVDTERGNRYNTYRVRPKRSAVYKYVFSLIKGVTVLWQQGGYLCRNFMIVIVSISCLSARMSAIINSSILHTSFRRVC